MKNISIWKDNLNKKVSFPKLNNDLNVDVLIIGGGITGISIYYELADTNLNICLVEQAKIGMSTTSNSTGKLSFLQNDLIDKIRNSFDERIASIYLKSQIDAINLVVNIIKKEKINCDLERVDSLLYTNKEDEINKIKNLEKFLKKNKIKVNKGNKTIVKSKYMISVGNTYIFNPLKFVYGLVKKNYHIYENTSILKIKEDYDGFSCYTDNNVIRTKWVIMASHYPYFNIPFMFPIKSYIEKSYLSASKYTTDNISLISYSNPFVSIRTYKDYLIYLSNSHSLNSKVDDKEHFNELLKKINDLKLKADYLWSNSDIMTNDGLPYIGEIKKNMLIATGYNTWGLATSVLASTIIKDIILENKNKYIELFNPTRINIDQLIKPFSNAFKSISGYINGIKRQESIKYNGKVMEYNENIVLNKCPHMGCKLKFNEIEKTWDCPCHGSRFDLSGNIISAPANKNIKIDNS